MSLLIDIKKDFGDFKLSMNFENTKKRIGILGASGCGKSMTLKCIAGIIKPDRGIIKVGDRVFFDSEKKVNLSTQQRKVGFLFQNYALFPNMTVEKNVGVGIKGDKQEKKEKVDMLLKKLGLDGMNDRLPSQLSGGQQQRVALARILAIEPSIILLDEPFSALDAFLKDHLQREVQGLLADFDGEILMVSHSRDEIYRFADELMIMKDGCCHVKGDTEEIFRYPKCREAAILTGCKNITAAKKLGDYVLFAKGWGLELKTSVPAPEDVAWVGVRAHCMEPAQTQGENTLKVQAEGVDVSPFEETVLLKTDGGEIISWKRGRDAGPMPGYLRIAPEAVLPLSD